MDAEILDALGKKPSGLSHGCRNLPARSGQASVAGAKHREGMEAEISWRGRDRPPRHGASNRDLPTPSCGFWPAPPVLLFHFRLLCFAPRPKGTAGRRRLFPDSPQKEFAVYKLSDVKYAGPRSCSTWNMLLLPMATWWSSPISGGCKGVVEK